jgi:CRP/FNR family transcriptional regulator, cyclic AMP receptor protein
VAKDVFDSLSGVVPRSIAGAGRGGPTAAGRPRPDEPLGKRGVELLAHVPLFAGLSRRHLKRLAERADLVSFRERETIVEAGQPGGSFYVIVAGEARVMRGGKVVGRLEPGEFFGEVSLLDGGPRTATVVAGTPVTTIRIFKRSFDRVLAEEPKVAAQILAVVARRLRDAERSIGG